MRMMVIYQDVEDVSWSDIVTAFAKRKDGVTGIGGNVKDLKSMESYHLRSPDSCSVSLSNSR